MEQRERRAMPAPRVIALGFLAAIAVGTLLLMLPAAAASGEGTGALDALFTATTSVCVTGLTTVDTFAHWSGFGQAVILVLIQCGGLGIITFSMQFLLLLHRKITLRDRLLLQEAFNLETLSGLLGFLSFVVRGTLAVEGIGAALCLPVFVPEYGAGRGIWLSVFHAVSAFCNAGLDLIGPNSLVPYAGHVWLNAVTMALIVLGGVGFILWWDVRRVARLVRAGGARKDQFFHRLSLHTKVTLTMTGILLFGGAALFLALEWNNPATLGGVGVGGKILRALFQSVTTRTAGFATVDQRGLTSGSVLLSAILMFIGGSSVGTAGGVKTSTVAVLLLSGRSTVLGKRDVTAFRRSIPMKTVRRALAVVLISLVTLLAALMLLCPVQGGDLADLLFETASALGTTGLTRGVTAQSGAAGRLILAGLMYFGRVGPISLAIAFAGRGKAGAVYPEQDVTIG